MYLKPLQARNVAYSSSMRSRVLRVEIFLLFVPADTTSGFRPPKVSSKGMDPIALGTWEDGGRRPPATGRSFIGPQSTVLELARNHDIELSPMKIRRFGWLQQTLDDLPVDTISKMVTSCTENAAPPRDRPQQCLDVIDLEPGTIEQVLKAVCVEEAHVCITGECGTPHARRNANGHCLVRNGQITQPSGSQDPSDLEQKLRGDQDMLQDLGAYNEVHRAVGEGQEQAIADDAERASGFLLDSFGEWPGYVDRYHLLKERLEPGGHRPVRGADFQATAARGDRGDDRQRVLDAPRRDVLLELTRLRVQAGQLGDHVEGELGRKVGEVDGPSFNSGALPALGTGQRVRILRRNPTRRAHPGGSG